jgi:hypothetical protein
MNLFELRGQHRSLIAKAETILNAAKAEGRELTPEEGRQVDGFLDQAKPLAVKIRESEDINTILQFDPRALVMGALVKRGGQDPAKAAVGPIPHAVIRPKEAALKRQFSAWSKRMVGNLTGMPQADDYTPEIEARRIQAAQSVLALAQTWTASTSWFRLKFCRSRKAIFSLRRLKKQVHRLLTRRTCAV